jgi:hypothetical protein
MAQLRAAARHVALNRLASRALLDADIAAFGVRACGHSRARFTSRSDTECPYAARSDADSASTPARSASPAAHCPDREAQQADAEDWCSVLPVRPRRVRTFSGLRINWIGGDNSRAGACAS